VRGIAMTRPDKCSESLSAIVDFCFFTSLRFPRYASFPHSVIWQEGTVIRERALKVVMVLVGLLFTAGVYPATMTLWGRDQSGYGDDA
jgi:hypothetical protein